jgi:hypothetical protein
MQLSHENLSHDSLSDTLRCGSSVCPIFNDLPAKAATLLQISEPMSYILTEVLNIAKTDFIATVIGKYAVIGRSYGYGFEPFHCT